MVNSMSPVLIKKYYATLASEKAQISPAFQQTILKELLNLVKGESILILDLGSALGNNLLTILSIMKDPSIIATDISRVSLRKSKEIHGRTASFLACDAENLPFHEGIFDVVVCTEVLEHVPNLLKAVKEIKRVQKNDSYIIASVPNYQGLVGSYKRVQDARKGYRTWEPWGAHKDGFERHTNAKLLFRVLRKADFEILQSRGGGYILPFLFFGRFKVINDSIPFVTLGKVPFLRELGMHYYVLARASSPRG